MFKWKAPFNYYWYLLIYRLLIIAMAGPEDLYSWFPYQNLCLCRIRHDNMWKHMMSVNSTNRTKLQLVQAKTPQQMVHVRPLHRSDTFWWAVEISVFNKWGKVPRNSKTCCRQCQFLEFPGKPRETTPVMKTPQLRFARSEPNLHAKLRRLPLFLGQQMRVQQSKAAASLHCT